MFGFKAFSEAPISAEVEAQTTVVVVENVGAIGASAIGVHAIGRATTTVVGGTSATASASIPAITVSSPAPTATVSVTGSASVPAITLTSPAPTVTVSSTASATAATITVTSPAPTVSAGVTASAASSTVTVTSPASTASASVTATASDATTVTTTSADARPEAVQVTDFFNADTRITKTQRSQGIASLTLTLPTTIVVDASVATDASDAGTYTANYANTVPFRLVNWDYQWVLSASHGKRSSDTINKYNLHVHTFDSSGNLTLIYFQKHYLSLNASGGATGNDEGHAIRGAVFMDSSIEAHSAASGADYYAFVPVFTNVGPGSDVGKYATVDVIGIQNYNSKSPTITTTRSASGQTSITLGGFEGKLSSSTTDIVPIGIANWKHSESTVNRSRIPWRGDWSTRSRQNYILWSYRQGSSGSYTYYLKLLAENGDIITVNSTTNQSAHTTEANKFTDGSTYPNLLADNTFSNGTSALEKKAERNQSLSGTFANLHSDIDADVNRTASLALTVSAPEPALASNAIASASPGTVSLSAPSPTLSVSSTASAALVTVSVTAPTVTATSTASATASASIPSITVGVPLVNETVVEIPLPTPAISVSSPAPQATSTSTASATIPSVTVTTPQVSATSASTASATVPAITVTSPAPTASASATVSLDLHKATQTFTVTVQSTYYGNKYYIDGVQQASLSLHEEGTYRFDLSDSSVSNHPLRFSTTSNGTHNSGTQYTTGVTVVGTAGSSGAYVEIVVTSSTPDLYYYCTNHSGMGGSIAFSSDFTQVPFILSVSSVAPTLSVGSIGEAQAASVALTAAEATATGAAEATFADSIEVGVVSPAPTTTVIALPSIPSITVTVPTVSATADTSATASASLPTITVTSPAASASSDTQTDNVNGSSTATGSSVLVRKGEASVTGTATASSNEAFRAKGTGSLAGQATASGSSTLLKVGSSSVSGSTNASASCTIVKDASSTISTTSTSSGTALSVFNGDGSLATDSTASGTAGFQLGAFGTLNGTSEVSALSFVLNPIDVNSLTSSNIVRIYATYFDIRIRSIYDGRQSRDEEIMADTPRTIGIYR